MERLTHLASANSHTVDRLQGLEAQLEKSNSQKASVEAREKKVKEDASLVSLEVDCYRRLSLLYEPFEKQQFIFLLQTTAQLQKEIDAVKLEKQNLEKRFDVSIKEAQGNKGQDFCVCHSYFNFHRTCGGFYTSRELRSDEEEPPGREGV